MKNRIIKLASGLFSFIAILYAASPCYGRYYEPEMPEELWMK